MGGGRVGFGQVGACRWIDDWKGRKEGRDPDLERLRCSSEDSEPSPDRERPLSCCVCDLHAFV